VASVWAHRADGAVARECRAAESSTRRARRRGDAIASVSRRARQMIHFALLFSKQGKIRLSKYYVVTSQKDRKRIERDAVNAIIPRPAKACNVVEYKDMKLIYRKYAVDREANELATLEQIQHYVEILDKYFGNVCELDLVFNFHKAHYVLDEVFIAGHLQETSKKLIARLVGEHDALVESAKFGGLAGEDS
jgi:AP-1 complex subunit sigma 1/2